VSRNVAHVIAPPKTEGREIESLTTGQMGEVLSRLKGHALLPIVALALATGMRRGEMLALQWGDVNFAGAELRIERSLEETKAGLKLKPPKTRHGRRCISLPASAVEALKSHRKAQLEARLSIGLGKLDPHSLVFCNADGSPMSPDNLSRDWRRAVKALKLPDVMFLPFVIAMPRRSSPAA